MCIIVRDFICSAIVRKVVDGDTLEIDIDLGLLVWVKKERIRLYGINTPNVYGVKKGSSEWQSSVLASEFVKTNLKENEDLIVETIKDTKENMAVTWLSFTLGLISR